MSNHPCLKGQKQRGDVCCWTVQCKAEGFIPCNAKNGTDVCVPCPDGQYIADTYHTDWFERSQCVDKPTCLQEQIRNEKGICVCDRTKGYIKQGGGDENICVPTLVKCNKPGEELHESGYCSNCIKGFYKPESSTDLCQRKTNITCQAGETIKEGDRFTDRSCVPNPFTKPLVTTERTITTISTSTHDGEFPIGAVVGSICGGGAIILLIVIIIYLIKRRRKKRPSKRKKEKGEKRETELLKSGTEHEEQKDTMDTLEEQTMSYNSGLKENNKKATAVPIDEEETFEKQPHRNTEEQNIPIDDTAHLDEEETFENQPPRISGERNIPFADEEEFHRATRESVAEEDQNNPRPVATVAAQVHEPPRQQESLHLLTHQPSNDDNGRLVNGLNSFSLEMQNGQLNRVANNGVPPGVRVVDSLSSDPYDPIRPSDSSTSS
ncbi:uncharacterized protein LOC127719864 isoform X2 [Mytilus californianus]|uniref:uncharacterized protein LOC127719864 isoform X2 n=1 Tax=Mytilus californianus TaxID=6549 RepID=UPI002246EA8B|nr:uncharacterized protein LOC127719864 isoform X2 [Mytilus californianus]